MGDGGQKGDQIRIYPQPAVQKFAVIIYSNPPTSGDVRDYTLMDLCHGRMHEEYSACSHTYPKECPIFFRNI